MQQLGVCFNILHPLLCRVELCRRFSLLMGFGLVACWGRGALYCCIVSWLRRFLEANGHYTRTASSRAFVLLVLVPCITLSMASGFDFPSVGERGWYALYTFFLPCSTWEHLPRFPRIFPSRGGDWTRRRYFTFKMGVHCEKEEGPQTSCTQWL